MFLQRSKNIQIISKVAVVELYNKMVQQQFIYLFRLAWGFELFSHGAGKSCSFSRVEIIYSSAFVS